MVSTPAQFEREKADRSQPGEENISAINDNTRFDESAATRAVVEPLRYFRGKPDVRRWFQHLHSRKIANYFFFFLDPNCQQLPTTKPASKSGIETNQVHIWCACQRCNVRPMAAEPSTGSQKRQFENISTSVRMNSTMSPISNFVLNLRIAAEHGA